MMFEVHASCVAQASSMSNTTIGVEFQQHHSLNTRCIEFHCKQPQYPTVVDLNYPDSGQRKFLGRSLIRVMTCG